MLTSPDLFFKVKVLRPAVIVLGFATQQACDSAISFYSGLLGQYQYPPFIVRKDVCVYCKVTDDNTTNTVVYWEIVGKTVLELTDAYTDLVNKHGCKGVEEPISSGQAAAETVSCTLLDPADNLFGLVINPPRPLVRGDEQGATMQREA